MGALTFIIYDETFQIYNIKFTEEFLKMKEKGPDYTSYTFEHSQNINKISNDVLKMNLTRAQLADYLMHTFIYKYHRLSINDESHDGHQPFEDPILHKIKEYPILRNRPKRKLLCDGEIYNYKQLIESEQFSDKDIQSSCDVEVILPLYIKYGIEKTLNMLNGDFSFVLTENTNTFMLDTVNIFCARDKYGIRPLWYISNNRNFHMFTSDMVSVPEFILNDKNYKVAEVQPGTYWSFNTKNFNRYTDYTTLTKSISITKTSTSPHTLSIIYNQLKTLLKESCSLRLHNESYCILFDNNNHFDSYLLTSLLLYCEHEYLATDQYPAKDKDIHIFFNVNENNYNDDVIENYKNFINYTESKYTESHSNSLKIQYHIIICNDNSQQTNQKDTQTNYTYIFEYIKETLGTLNLKVMISTFGLNNVFNNTTIQTTPNKYGYEIRFPYLDDSFVNCIKNLDPILKEKRSYKANTKPIDKYIIRKSFEDMNLLPTQLLWSSYDDI